MNLSTCLSNILSINLFFHLFINSFFYSSFLFFRNMILLRTFRQFDYNRDGEISRDEFYKAVNELGHSMTQEQVDELIQEADLDKSHTLNYKEFCRDIYG